MDLNDILALARVEIEHSTICIIRHTTKQLGEGEYLLDPDILRFYTSVQKKGKLGTCKHAMVFAVAPSGKAIFRGFYDILGKNQLQETHIKSIALSSKVKAEYEQLASRSEYDHYTLERSSVLSDYEGRIVIDWGGAYVSWFQHYDLANPKQVLEILPKGYFGDFNGYMDISLSRTELEYLFRNQDSNPIWKGHLSRVSGIYLILDENTGQQYIGSAYGSHGIWGRWDFYYKSPDGGNVALKELLEKKPAGYEKNFRYSILEVMPGNALKNDVLAKESLFKKKLGTRVFGFNQN
jgi:hypothetical protein